MRVLTRTRCMACDREYQREDLDRDDRGHLSSCTPQPDLVRPGYEHADHDSGARRFLLMHGLSKYTETGVIGYPSLATAEKGKRVLDGLTSSFRDHLAALAEE
ncbi:hypothetical protein [Streptomyces sp. NPDC055400]